MTDFYHFDIRDYPEIGYKKKGSFFSRLLGKNSGDYSLDRGMYKLRFGVAEWLRENATEEKWHFDEDQGRLAFVFDDEAMAFKLGYL